MAGVPLYKVIPGTNFTVDGFRYPQSWIKAYFLTHAHSDHYTGLNENWSAGPIYCSPVTAALAEHLAGVPAEYLHSLQLNTPYVIEGVQVVLVDANHCPGAVQLLFELPDGSKYIHCGDMRYCTQMQANQHLARFRGANAVFLDTTYCRPRHTFPAQEAAVEFVASCVQQLLQEDAQADSQAQGTDDHLATGNRAQDVEEGAAITHDGGGSELLDAKEEPVGSNRSQQLEDHLAGQQVQQQAECQVVGDDICDSQVTAGEALGFKRLYLISTYVIGKERLLLAVARRTGRRLLVTQRKLEVLRRVGLSDVELSAYFTTDPRETPIHVLRWGVLGDTWPYFRPNYSNMEQALTQTEAQEVVGFVPTGWLHEMSKAAAKGTFPCRTKGSCTVWLIPYSEHSSFAELKEYVAWLRPKQVIPTVNVGEVGAAGDKHRNSMLQHFRGLLDETSNKAAFLARMTSAAAAAAATMAVMTATAGGTEPANGNNDAGANQADATAGDAGDNAPGAELLYANVAAADSSEGFGECEDPSRPTTIAITAAHGVGTAAAASTQPDTLANMENAGQQLMTAATDPGQGATAAADVELLLAIAGPDSLLSSTDAQQLLMAAKGDVNAAINAFLDDSYNGNKQSAAAQLPPAAGGGSSNSRKLQLKQSVSTNNRKGSKKQSKQAAATGQAAITAFFGQATRDNSQKQQHSVRTTEAVPLDAHRVLKHQQLQQATPHLSAAVPQHSPGTAAAAAASAAGPVVGFQIVLPSLGCKSSPPTPAAAAARPPHLVAVSQQSLATPTAHVAVMNASSAVAQQAREAPSHRDLASPPAAQADHSSPPPSPSPAVADAVVDAFQQQPKQPATAEGPSRDSGPGRLGSAAEAPAGPITEQQQQQSAKQSWAAVFPGALTPTAKRRKVSAAVTTAAQLSPKPIQSITAVAVHKVALPDQAALPDRAALPLPAPDAHNTAKSMLSGSISSGSSISRSVRDAPLLPLTRYNPLTDACWPPGTAAPYLALGLTLAAVDGTTSRLKIADGLTNLFRSLMLMSPGDVTAAAYLFCGKIAPEYTSGCELNVGGGVVSSALCEVCGVTRNQLREMYAQHGDLGDVAQACRRRQTSLLPPPPLTITGLFNTLHSLAAQAGQGAAGRRQSTVARLLRCCRDVETKYLVRTLVQNLRVGAGWKSVLGPLAKAALLHRNMMQAAGLLPPTTEQQQQQQQQVQASALDPAAMAAAAQHAGSAAAKVTKTQLEAAAAAAAAAYHTCPNLGIIVDVLMTVGPEGLATKVQLTCGVPVKPMLARPCTSTADALQQLAATAAVAATGGKRPCRNAGGDISSSKQGRQTTAAAIPAAADAVGLEAEDVSDVEADEADDVIMIDHVMSSAITAPAVVAGEGAVSARAGATAAAVNSVLSILAEYKYDGQRAQIHVGQDRQVHVFSRNCEDRTHSFPDVAAAILAAVASAALPLVVDAELAAVDRSDGNRIRAFQELASRPRGSAAGAAGPGSNAVRSSAAAATTAESSDAGGQRPTQQQQQQRQKQHKLDLTSAPSSVDMVQSHQQHQDRHQVQRPHESGIDVCVFVFDTLCVGGVDMMGRSLRERRAALVEALPGAAAGVVQLAEGVELQLGSTAEAAAESLLTVTADDVTASTETAQQLSSAAAGAVEDAEQSVTDFFFKALAAGTEGLMLKLLDGPGSVYQPAKRGLSWIKLKRDYLEGLADSIDLVPIGAWQGQGRKVKWYSPFLLAVYDPATETYQSLCRCMSGFTDEFYAAATARLGTSAVPGPKPYYETFERPDVWFEPTEVWEIRGADVSISPVHRAAAGRLHTDRGLGLRFPRFLRIREDKHPDEASGPEFIVDLYNKQTRRVVNK